MKKLKQFLLGTSWLWLPIVGCYIAEIITNLFIKIL